MIILFWTILTVFVNSNIPEFKSTLPETMYLGVENQIPVSLNGAESSDIEVKISSGTVYRRDDSTFAFQPQIQFDEFKIKLYYKNVICQIKTIKLKSLPELIPYFEGEQSGFIKKANIDKIGKLGFSFPEDFPTEMKGQIVYFNIYIHNPSGVTIYSSTNRSAELDNNAMQVLKTVEVGSRISINNIVTSSPRTGQVRNNASREIVVI